MGKIWLTDGPDILRDAGLTVEEEPGHETRSRSSGGYESVLAIGMHHNAARASTSLDSAARHAWHNSSSRPIGAAIIDVDGTWRWGASGATNTQGKGGPWTCSKGTIPKDRGNLHMLSFEPMNDGVWQPWPPAQIESLLVGCKAFCDALGLDPLRDILAHFEYTNPGKSVFTSGFRKIDPADVSLSTPYGIDGAAYQGMFDMDRWRRDVAAINLEEDNEVKWTDYALVLDYQEGPNGRALMLVGPGGAIQCDGLLRDQAIAGGCQDRRTNNVPDRHVVDTWAKQAGVR